MKKLIVTFFVLLLVPALATASTNMVSITELRQQAENMGRWTQTYEAHGRTIEVDIPIIVPEVERCPVVTLENQKPWNETMIREIQKKTEKRDGGDILFV